MMQITSRSGMITGLSFGGRELLSAPQSLLALFLRTGDGQEIILTSRDCLAVSEREEDGAQRILFSGFAGYEALSAEAVIRRRPEGIFFDLTVENQTDCYLEAVQFPYIKIKNDLLGRGGNSRVFLPYCEGVVIEEVEPSQDEKRYPGLINMQFLGYYDEEGGLYFGCEDVECTPKSIDCKPAGEELELEIKSFVAIAPGERFEKKEYSVLRPFCGDWQDCCRLYRSFAENSAFPLPEKCRDWKGAPQWYRESPLIVIYPVRSIVGLDYFGPNEYFPYRNGKKYMDELREELGQNVMALLMNWEGSAPWCPPFVWPPYGGADGFEEFVKEMHADGQYVGLYASGINWTDQSAFCPEYDMTDYRKENGIDRILCTKPDGSPDEERCVRSVRSGYHLCPACEGTRQMTYDQISQIAESGVDYLQYFDQNLGGAPDLCYSKEHGHPPVRGVWSTHAMQRIYREIMEIMKEKNPNCLLGAESSPSDCFLDELKTNDQRYVWPMGLLGFTGISRGRAVPAFQFVFHEYSMNFMGNQCAIGNEFTGEDHPDFLNLRLAYSFTAGDMLTVVLKSGGEIHFGWGPSWLQPGPNQVTTKRFLKELCGMRAHLGRPFLQYGRMEKCPEVQCAAVRLQGKKRQTEYPAVFASRWTDPDGRRAVILVNYTNEPRQVTVAGEYENSFQSDEILPPKGNSFTLAPFEVLGLMEK